jgi:hypothetical protein
MGIIVLALALAAPLFALEPVTTAPATDLGTDTSGTEAPPVKEPKPRPPAKRAANKAKPKKKAKRHTVHHPHRKHRRNG